MIKHLPELTSLRFIAAAYVVMFHAFDTPDSQDTLFATVVHKGYLGVDFFFILSGFILMHVYLAAYREGNFRYREFLLNRLARVYPLHIAVLSLFVFAYSAAAIFGLTGSAVGMNWDHLPWHVLVVHAWGFTDGHSWNFPSWSISAEAFAYIIFPLFLFIGNHIRPTLGLLASVGLFAVAYLVIWMSGARLTALMFDFGIVRIFFEFLLGAHIYIFLERHKLPGQSAKMALYMTCLLVFLLIAFKASDVMIIPIFAATLYFAGCLSLDGGSIVMRSKVLVYLGEISYATYMIHFFVLMVAEKIANKAFNVPIETAMPWFVFAPAVIVIYGLSALLYHGIERPSRIAIRSLGKRVTQRV